MLKLKKELSVFVIFVMFAAILPLPPQANTQDLVASEALAGGSSVFVFRESRKKPQSRAGGGRVSLAAGGQVRQPDWGIASNQLGLGYRGLNNLSAALQQFNRVVAIDGNNVMGLFNLGSTQYASGDKKGAKKSQDRLKKINPDLANRLGNVIAGKLIDEGTRRIKDKIKIPGIPF